MPVASDPLVPRNSALRRAQKARSQVFPERQKFHRRTNNFHKQHLCSDFCVGTVGFLEQFPGARTRKLHCTNLDLVFFEQENTHGYAIVGSSALPMLLHKR